MLTLFCNLLYNGPCRTSSSDGAVVGINVGDGINHVTIPGSRTSSILNIEVTSNVGVPGTWIFRVDRGNIL